MPRAFTADIVERDPDSAGADLQDQGVRPVGLKVTNRRHAVGLHCRCHGAWRSFADAHGARRAHEGSARPAT